MRVMATKLAASTTSTMPSSKNAARARLRHANTVAPIRPSSPIGIGSAAEKSIVPTTLGVDAPLSQSGHTPSCSASTCQASS